MRTPYNMTSQFKTRLMYEQLGLCKQCGKLPAQAERKFCFECLLAQSKRSAIYRAFKRLSNSVRTNL